MNMDGPLDFENEDPLVNPPPSAEKRSYPRSHNSHVFFLSLVDFRVICCFLFRVNGQSKGSTFVPNALNKALNFVVFVSL